MAEKKSAAKAAPKAAAAPAKSPTTAGSAAVAASSAPAPVAATAAKAAPAKTATAAPKGKTLDVSERQRLVAEAAYYRAEKRGFAPGNDLQDWVEAEHEIASKYPR
jgi:hypothetical protein